MKRPHFYYFDKEEQQETLKTFPNIVMTGGRVVGGIAMFGLLARQDIGPVAATVGVTIGGASDAEGFAISTARYLSARYPSLGWLQSKLKIIPSKIGPKIDPVADKVFGVGVTAGGMIGGSIPLELGLPIAATEAVIAGVSLSKEATGHEVIVNKYGKGRILALGETIISQFMANATEGTAHQVLQVGAEAGLAGVVGLSALNVYHILHDSARRQPEQ